MIKVNTDKKREYFKNLDFLRFIFAVIIVIFHMIRIACVDVLDISQFSTILFQSENMNRAVECFFILSGFLLIMTDKNEVDLISYLKNKFYRLSPTIIFCVLIFLFMSFFGITKFYFFNNLFSIFFINGFEIGTAHGINGAFGNVHSTWFISVLIWVSLFYRYLLKTFGEKVFYFITFCMVFLSLFWVSKEFYRVLSMGMLRGLYSIGIGCLIAMLYKNNIDYIKNNFNSIKAKISISFLELAVFTYFILTMCLSKIEKLSFGEYVVLFSIVLFAFVIKKGVLSNFLNKDYFAYLGKFAYSIFVSHCILLDVFQKYIYTSRFVSQFPNWGGIIFVLSIICCVVLGVAVYFLVEKPCYQFYKNKLNN